jgi:hypothetical protein
MILASLNTSRQLMLTMKNINPKLKSTTWNKERHAWISCLLLKS